MPLEQNSHTTQRRCPYCDEVHASQGLHSHIMNSVGGGHGDRYETPDGFSLQDAPIVDEPKTDKPTHSGLADDDHYYYCLWCNTMHGGERGLKIHLSHQAGDENHPANASIEDRHFTLVPADENGDPIISEDDVARRSGRLLNTETTSTPTPQNDTSSPDTDTIKNTAPNDKTNIEQVVAVLKQYPALYHDPDTVTRALDIDRSIFDHGRNLYELTVDQREGGD